VVFDFICLLFFIGVCGIVFNRRNFILLMVYVELTLFAISFNFILFSLNAGDSSGQIAALFILAVAAADAAVGLGILVNSFQQHQTISISQLNASRG